MRGQKFIYAHRFKGMPKVTDLQLVEEEIPPIKNGGICMINDYNPAPTIWYWPVLATMYPPDHLQDEVKCGYFDDFYFPASYNNPLHTATMIDNLQFIY